MNDLRDFLAELQDKGELLVLKEEIDPHLEAAALASMSCRSGAQAIHFSNVKGYAPDYSLAANLFTGPGNHYYFYYKRALWGRIAIALGLDPKIEYETLIPTINDRLSNPILPVKVTTAPCKEIVHRGQDVDLFKLPFPYLHQEDGGRYGMGVLIVKDLESDWQNWGVYKFMIAGNNHLAADFLSEPRLSRDSGAIYKKYATLHKSMPFTIALGGSPSIMLAAASKLPSGMSEVEYAGGLNLDPINVVKAETSNLLVPGDAEIIIEGEIIPDEVVEEGPYGSIKGYSDRHTRPLMKVTAITHRKEPIMPFVVDGTKVSDTQSIIAITESARIWRKCVEEMQFPIKWVQIPPDWNLGICVVAFTTMVHGLSFRIAHYIFSISNLFDKILFVDADVYAAAAYTFTVDWYQKSHPIKDYHIIENFPPAVMPNYREREPGKGTPRLYIDATWPAWYKAEEKPIPVSFETSFPREMREKVLKRWKEELHFPVEPFTAPEGQRC